MIVDTNFLIAIDNEDPAAKREARALEAAGVPLRIPTVVIVELYISVGLGSTPNANARQLEPLVANQPVVELDENVARRAGVLLGLHQSSETKPQLGVVDAVVAATGLVYNEPVITDDADDFGSVEGLEVTDWS